MMWRDGVVSGTRTAWGPAGRSCAELDVEITGAPKGASSLMPGLQVRAVAYEALTGVPVAGERVRLEVSALDRALGTGGHAMVSARLDALPADPPREGHLVKARYMPDQVMVTGVDEQGTDHHGTIARVRAGLQAAGVGIPQGYPDYVLHTMVRVMRGGQEVKISKRAGSYVTLRDLIEWTSKDAVRFFLLSRKPDTEYTFDVDLAIQKNNDNPVYYVQYAHARLCSLAKKAAAVGVTADNPDLSLLTEDHEGTLIRTLGEYPTVVKAAAELREPHRIARYIEELAGTFHRFYATCQILPKVGEQAQPIHTARLALATATRQVIANALGLLGVTAPEQM